MSAKLITKKEAVPVVTRYIEKPVGVTLNLTLEEAFTLAELFSQVGGCPDNSARKYINNVRNKLGDVGINWKHGRKIGLYAGVFKNASPYIELSIDSDIIINQDAANFQEFRTKNVP